MATGGRTLPSATGGGLERAGRAIFEALLARRQLDLRDREVDVAERASKINQFISLSNFLPAGTRLGSLGQAGMVLFGDAFGIPTEGLEDLELKPETIQTILDSRGVDFLKTNPEAGDLLLPAIRGQLGLEPDADVAAARGLQARMQTEALNSILGNPEMKAEFVSRTLGREPIHLTVPRKDGTSYNISFDSPTAANIYAQFLLAQDRERFDLSIRDGEETTGLVEEIQKAVNEAGQNVSSTAITGRLIPTYNQAVRTGNAGLVQNFLETASPGEALAMQYLLGSIKVGEETFLDQLREAAPELANFLEIGNAVREVLGPEQAAEVLPGITEALGGVAGTLKDPLFGGLQFEFGGTLGAPSITGAPTGSLPREEFRNVPRDALIEAAQNLFRDGTQTRQELEASLGAEIVQAALGSEGVSSTPAAASERKAPEIPEGGFDPAVVPENMRGKARQLNTLLTRQARDRASGLSSSRGPQGIDAAVSRLQREIRAAMLGPEVEFALDVVTLEQDEGGIPAGGIKPESVPVVARADVRVLNSLLKRRKNATGRAARDLDGQIANRRQRIQEAIANQAATR